MAAPTRIGMISDNTYPPDPRVKYEAEALIDDGFEVHLFSLSYKSKLPEIEIIHGIHVHRYNASRLIYKASALAHTFPFFRWLVAPKVRRFIQKVNPDALHVHDMVLAETVFQINKKLNLPLVLDLHENRPEIMKVYKHVNQFPGNILIRPNRWHKKEQGYINYADKIVVVTGEARDHYLQHNDRKAEDFIIIPNAGPVEVGSKIDPEDFAHLDGFFNLLYFGDTSIRRGLPVVFKAMALVKAECQDLRLIIVGMSSDDAELKSMAEALEVSHLIFWEGWQSPEKLPDYIRHSKVGLCPFRRNLHHDTTYSNKMFQYMQMGLPVVASDCRAQKKVILDNEIGVIYQDGDEKALADLFRKLYKAPKLLSTYSENAVKTFNTKYKTTLVFKDLIKFYGKI